MSVHLLVYKPVYGPRVLLQDKFFITILLALLFPFLSPPVLMHGGLLCIAFCLSLEVNSLEVNSYFKNYNS